LPVHVLPLVGFEPSGVQSLFAPHVWLQQSELATHALLSATHSWFEQTPPMHPPVQHSLPVTQPSAGSVQATTAGAHLPVAALQFAEQQSALVAHVPSVAVHTAASKSRLGTIGPSVPPSLMSGGLLLDPSVFAESEAPSGAPGAASSLPHPAATTFTRGTRASSPRRAHGSLFMAVLPTSAQARA
jgi:hypothetical protein